MTLIYSGTDAEIEEQEGTLIDKGGPHTITLIDKRGPHTITLIDNRGPYTNTQGYKKVTILPAMA